MMNIKRRQILNTALKTLFSRETPCCYLQLFCGYIVVINSLGRVQEQQKRLVNKKLKQGQRPQHKENENVTSRSTVISRLIRVAWLQNVY